MAEYKDPQDCECGGIGKRIIDGFPFARMGGEGSDRQISLMQKDYKSKFVNKGGADEARHKHGADVVNDSLRAGELNRRASGKADD